MQIEKLVRELSGFNNRADTSVSIDLKEEDLTTAAATLSDETKRLPKLRVSGWSGREGVQICMFVFCRLSLFNTISVINLLLLQVSNRFSSPQKDQIYNNCKSINEDCQKLIREVTEKVRGQLRPLWSQLSQVWSLNQTSDGLRTGCSALDAVLEQVSMERAMLLRSISVSFIYTIWQIQYFFGKIQHNYSCTP